MRLRKTPDLQFLAETALLNSHQLPPLDRARIYDAAAALLDEARAKAARDAAFHIREADRAQARLFLK